jgi:hypothetical protein
VPFLILVTPLIAKEVGIFQLREEIREFRFLPSATRLSGVILIHGFASQPRDWFAFVEKEA